MLKKVADKKSYPGGDSSPLANTALVSSTPPYANQCTKMLTTELPLSDSQLWSTDTGTPKPFKTGCLAHFRKALSENEISEAGEMLTASWRQGTNKNMTQLGESRKVAGKMVCYFDVSKISTHFCVLF